MFLHLLTAGFGTLETLDITRRMSVCEGTADYHDPRAASSGRMSAPLRHGRLKERSAVSAASSNCASSLPFTPLSLAATFRAHSTYSALRSTDQSAGGLAVIARRLLVLSPSFSTLA